MRCILSLFSQFITFCYTLMIVTISADCSKGRNSISCRKFHMPSLVTVPASSPGAATKQRKVVCGSRKPLPYRLPRWQIPGCTSAANMWSTRLLAVLHACKEGRKGPDHHRAHAVSQTEGKPLPCLVSDLTRQKNPLTLGTVCAMLDREQALCIIRYFLKVIRCRLKFKCPRNESCSRP